MTEVCLDMVDNEEEEFFLELSDTVYQLLQKWYISCYEEKELCQKCLLYL